MQFRKKTLDKIHWAKQAIEEEHGGPLTVRGIYYNLVVKKLIEKTEHSYDNLDYALIRAREEGLIPWDRIIDPTREAKVYTGWACVSEFLTYAPYQYSRDLLQTQERLVELWVEKRALAAYFEPYARKHQITLVVGGGYQPQSSISRFCEERFNNETRPISIAYFGDFDPSGLDIDRAFQESMKRNFGIAVDFKRYALTEEDIKVLPSHRAKKADPRYEGYKEKYGEECWELDALPKHTLEERIEKAISDHLDLGKFQQEVEKEKTEKDVLHEIIDKLKEEE